MNYTKCAECKQESHRREFRKKGGGFYTTYKRITRLNRDRIKAMEKKENPTKLTITWLNRRLAIQDEWHKALNYLLTRVHQGQQVGTLSEYMETRD